MANWLKEKLGMKEENKPFKSFDTEDDFRDAVAKEVQALMPEWVKKEVEPNNKEVKEQEKQPETNDDLPPTKEEVAKKEKEKGDE